jgi:tetratricopeptide (TPR) repeat protein
MVTILRRPSLRAALLAVLAALPPLAQARAEPGALIQDVELRTISGGKAHLLSARAKANVFVFFRTGQERSTDALKQMAACEKELAGKPIYWAAVVSGTEAPAEVQALVAQTGIKMPVLVDDGDVLYDRLGVRLHPMVGIADGKFVLAAMEPYRQIEYCEVIKTRIKMLIGEATATDLAKVTNPEKTPLPGADPMKKAQRDVNMARRLYEIGQYKDAVKFANKALEVAPVAHAFTVMGQAYAKMGKCPEATRAFEQAVKLDAKESGFAAEAKASCK